MKSVKRTAVLLIGLAMMTSGCVSMSSSPAYSLHESQQELEQKKQAQAEATTDMLWQIAGTALEIGGPVLAR